MKSIFYMLISILQDGCIKEKERFIELINTNEIKIGTVLKVAPAIPQLNRIFFHFIMFYDKNDNSFDYLHLRKNIFIKEMEIVNVPFDKIERYINFNYGVYVFNTYNKLDFIGMNQRVISTMKKPIPYGLKNEFCFNCETILSFLILGKRSKSSEIDKIEKKFGKMGSLFINYFDKLMVITNSIGQIQHFMHTERKE